MNSSLFERANAVLPFTPATDFSAKRGFLVTLAGDVATLSASATAPAAGVILDGTVTTQQSAIGILGALAGTVKLKCGGVITKGDAVIQNNDGTIVTDSGAGARVKVGIALEDGAADELIEVAPITPQVLS